MTTELYVAMAQAIQQRDRALSMVAQWQRKAEAAEQEIHTVASQLQASGNAPDVGVPVEQVQEQ